MTPSQRRRLRKYLQRRRAQKPSHMFLQTIKDWLDSIFAAFKAVKAEKAAEDVAASRPLVDHADEADAAINAEIDKFSASRPNTGAVAAAKKPN